MEAEPEASLRVPPPMVDKTPLEKFDDPPETLEFIPEDVLAKPPPTAELSPLAVFVVPPAIVEFEPEAALTNMADIDTFVDKSDSISYAHQGDDKPFDKIWQWRPDGDILIYKCILRACFGLNVSAYTSGNFDLNSVHVRITIHDSAGNQIDNPVLDVIATPTLTALTATGTLLFIVDDVAVPDGIFKVNRGNSVRLNVVINTTLGVGTEQVGVVPYFAFNTEDVTKLYTASVLRMFTKSGIDNAFPVIRDQAKSALVDYSGVTRENLRRGN